MGNYVYSNRLIGLTKPEADKFIIDNIVYFNELNCRQQITSIVVIDSTKLYHMEYNPNRVKVVIGDDNKISKVLYIG